MSGRFFVARLRPATPAPSARVRRRDERIRTAFTGGTDFTSQRFSSRLALAGVLYAFPRARTARLVAVLAVLALASSPSSPSPSPSSPSPFPSPPSASSPSPSSCSPGSFSSRSFSSRSFSSRSFSSRSFSFGFVLVRLSLLPLPVVAARRGDGEHGDQRGQGPAAHGGGRFRQGHGSAPLRNGRGSRTARRDRRVWGERARAASRLALLPVECRGPGTSAAAAVRPELRAVWTPPRAWSPQATSSAHRHERATSGMFGRICRLAISSYAGALMTLSIGTPSLTEVERRRYGRRAQLLAATSVGYNVVEAVVAITAGMVAGSIALVGFGLDSIVEVSSGRSSCGSSATHCRSPARRPPCG